MDLCYCMLCSCMIVIVCVAWRQPTQRDSYRHTAATTSRAALKHPANVTKARTLTQLLREPIKHRLDVPQEWDDTFEVLTWEEAVAMAKNMADRPLIDLDMDRPFTCNETLKKFITMQRTKVIVTFKYSGGAGLKPAYLAAAEKVKKRFDEVHIKKEVLPVVSAVDSGVFEIYVDDRLVYSKPHKRAAVYLRMRTIHWAIIKAKRRRRPGQHVYGDPFTLPLEFRPNMTQIMERASRKKRTRERVESIVNQTLSCAWSEAQPQDTSVLKHMDSVTLSQGSISSAELLRRFHEKRDHAKGVITEPTSQAEKEMAQAM